MLKDAQGQTVSGATSDAVALYDQAVRAYNRGYGDSPGLFDAARAASPAFAMAHLGKAWLFALANDPSLLGPARTLVQAVGKPDDERSGAWPLRRAAAGFGGRTERGGCAVGSAPDAVPVRSRGASGRDIARWLPWTLPVGARPDGTGSAVLVEGYARLRQPYSRSMVSVWKKPAIMPAPRTSRVRRPNWSRMLSGRIIPSRT